MLTERQEGERDGGETREREGEHVNRMYLPIWSKWLKTPIFAVTGKKNLGLDFGPNWLQNLNENKKHPLTVEVHQK